MLKVNTGQSLLLSPQYLIRCLGLCRAADAAVAADAALLHDEAGGGLSEAEWCELKMAFMKRTKRKNIK